mgnify:CR=1 FL=1
MKRKLDKKKIIKFVGQALLYIMFCASSTAILTAGFLANTIY